MTPADTGSTPGFDGRTTQYIRRACPLLLQEKPWPLRIGTACTPHERSAVPHDVPAMRPHTHWGERATLNTPPLCKSRARPLTNQGDQTDAATLPCANRLPATGSAYAYCGATSQKIYYRLPDHVPRNPHQELQPTPQPVGKFHKAKPSPNKLLVELPPGCRPKHSFSHGIHATAPAAPDS